MAGRLVIEGLACGRGGRLVVPPLNLTLRPGEAILVTGENGAGKSTLLRTLAGLLPPLAGHIHVEGLPAADGEPARNICDIAHSIGHRNALKGARRVGAELAFWARFLGGAPQLSPEAALAELGLPEGVAHLRCADLSAGQARRAALARLLVAHRPLWLLDEPTNALDAATQERFAALCRHHLSSGGMILAATHQPLDLGASARALVLEPHQAGLAPADSAEDESWEAIG